MGNKRGRPRKEGERYPSGDRKPEPAGIPPAVLQRIKTDGIKLGMDPRLGSKIGILLLEGRLTVSQAAAGLRVGEIYGRFERFKGLRRSTASPSYQMGFGGEVGVDEERMDVVELASHEQRIRAAEEEFKRLTGRENPLIPAGPVRAAIEHLCVDDRVVPGYMLPGVRAVLDQLVLRFQDGWRKAKGGTKLRDAAKPSPRPEESAPAAPKRDKSSMAAFETVLRKLRPDLGDDGVRLALDVTATLRARDEFSKWKVKRGLSKLRPEPLPHPVVTSTREVLSLPSKPE